VWQSVERGARQVVLLGGEAGAGKSRLAMEVALSLHRVGVAVIVGSCSADLGQPFDPLASRRRPCSLPWRPASSSSPEEVATTRARTSAC
jgi:predicted ATPase